MRWVQALFLFLSFCLFIPPHLRFERRIVPLGGQTIEAPPAKFSYQALFDQTYQKAVEDRFADRFAFKEILVRIESTLNMKVFREASTPSMSNPIILGRSGFLVEKSYINNANGVSAIKGDTPYLSPHSVAESARRLGAGVRRLNALGIKFALVLFPHKAWVYPESLDSDWVLPGGRTRAEGQYDNLLAHLRENSVSFVDGPKIFGDLRIREPETPLFSKGGAHWNYYSACHIIKDLIVRMQSQTPETLPPVHCELSGYHAAEGREMDLTPLLNIWDNSQFTDRVPTGFAKIKRTKNFSPIRFFYEGTSFSGELYDLLKNTGYASKTSPLPYVYYRRNQPMNWDEVLKSDWLIIEQSQGENLTVNTMEFIEDLAKQLEGKARIRRPLNRSCLKCGKDPLG